MRETTLTELMLDKFHEECGVFGIYGHTDAARLAYLGLYALQHRGQESCGIVTSDGRELRLERAEPNPGPRHPVNSAESAGFCFGLSKPRPILWPVHPLTASQGDDP